MRVVKLSLVVCHILESLKYNDFNGDTLVLKKNSKGVRYGKGK